MQDEKSIRFIDAIHFVGKQIEGRKLQYAIFYFGMLFIKITEIISPILFGIMINEIVYYQNFSLFLKLALTFLVLSIFSCILYYLVYELYLFIGNTINYNMRTALFKHLQILSAEELSDAEYGDTINLVQHYCEECMNFAIRDIVHNLNIIIQIALCLILVLQMKIPVAWVMVLLVLISVILTRKGNHCVKEYDLGSRTAYGHFVGWIYEIVNSIQNIRSFAAEDFVRDNFYEKQYNMLNARYHSDRAKVHTEQIAAFSNVVIQMVLYGILAMVSIRYSLSIGIVIIILAYFTQMKTSLEILIGNCLDMQKRLVVIAKIITFLRRETEGEIWEGKNKLSVTHPGIRFENVSFHYGKEKDVLSGIKMEIKPGEKFAIVGCSGSGKSTLAYLLMGFYKPQKGHIYVDQMELSSCSLNSIREKMGLIQQEVVILNTSIRENLCMNKNNISEQQIKEACISANIQSLVEELPERLDTIIGGDERDLSGGQKQRISIARNYIKDPQIIIFDEATSALDSRTEEQIFKSWEKVLEGKTVIMIAHRISTVMLCDRVAVLEEGKIVEMGTPLELYKNGSVFRKIFSISEEK